ncbi:hypothetical protein BOX37_05735 [Nocardia mangyaensis]|uniref:Uncharacterized protein n=1 Tax=Nocardia mangyaensis TaxID=2213200 RepID=A0A1J0VNG3_9NOCA|nr:hypothetical protein [Nocardia mangyaensis]APE33554.1 hypothetical protein BOX37_05735 [Nocardia mangyaensis]
MARIGWGLLFGLVGLCLGAATLFSLAQPVNAVAYWLGYGETMRVEVTKGSMGSSFGRDGRAGEGLVETDGRTVRLYGVDAGDTVTARPRLIEIGAEPHVHHSAVRAAEDLVWLLPSAMFGFPFALILLAVFAPQRVSRITQWLKDRSGKPGGSTPVDR